MKVDDADLIASITPNLIFGQVEQLSREERLFKLHVSFQ